MSEIMLPLQYVSELIHILIKFIFSYDEQLTCDIPAIPKKSEGFLL